MALKLPREKLKSVVFDDSSDDDKDTGSDLGLPLEKLNLGPKKKLLVLDLGGFLLDRVHKRDKATIPRNCQRDLAYGNFLGEEYPKLYVSVKFCPAEYISVFNTSYFVLYTVFKRPFCDDFLKFCFERFEVGLWSSAREHNVDGALSTLIGELRSKLLFVWDQEECTDSGFKSLEKRDKPIFLKELKYVWEAKHSRSWRHGQYSSSNTLMIDDDPYKALLNPPNTAIFPHEYKVNNVGDKFLGPKSELRSYLDGLADADDVPSYVKKHPFGQPAITPSHSNWDYYAKIIRRFGKVSDGGSGD
ncbi:hypothetical protein RJ640_030981 [Escallonia rubra]|uniref:Mitochondrial import inner membrane translocase subunit TIM50 n=1 Tax=Escallonia rubra TaxID=112253 RepID=A0AA88RAD0_9ASTE|nr:hypothetical protein RJ640_030981 [Escallonia rubra]